MSKRWQRIARGRERSTFRNTTFEPRCRNPNGLRKVILVDLERRQLWYKINYCIGALRSTSFGRETMGNCRPSADDTGSTIFCGNILWPFISANTMTTFIIDLKYLGSSSKTTNTEQMPLLYLWIEIMKLLGKINSILMLLYNSQRSITEWNLRLLFLQNIIRIVHKFFLNILIAFVVFDLCLLWVFSWSTFSVAPRMKPHRFHHSVLQAFS